MESFVLFLFVFPLFWKFYVNRRICGLFAFRFWPKFRPLRHTPLRIRIRLHSIVGTYCVMIDGRW
jgi:hypothetical protein